LWHCGGFPSLLNIPYGSVAQNPPIMLLCGLRRQYYFLKKKEINEPNGKCLLPPGIEAQRGETATLEPDYRKRIFYGAMGGTSGRGAR
jgi:hypothetical protein